MLRACGDAALCSTTRGHGILVTSGAAAPGQLRPAGDVLALLQLCGLTGKKAAVRHDPAAVWWLKRSWAAAVLAWGPCGLSQLYQDRDCALSSHCLKQLALWCVEQQAA